MSALRVTVFGALCLFSLWVGPVWSRSTPSPITLEIGEGMAPTNVDLIRRTLAFFDDIIEADMGVFLDHPVRLFLCAGSNAYAEVLEKEFRMKPEKALLQSRLTGGMSQNRSNVGNIAIKFPPPGTNAIAAQGLSYQTTAHELFHQVQGQLAGKYKGRGAYWLSEGSADLVGATVAERLGHQSLERWKLERVNTLRRSPSNASALEILRCRFDQWTALLEQKLHPYELADLMMFHLMHRTGEAGYRQVAVYYRDLGEGSNAPGAFAHAFGIDEDGFVVDFTNQLAMLMRSRATLEVKAWDGVEWPALAPVREEAARLREFMASNWAWDLSNSRRILAASNHEGFIAARVKDFGQVLSDEDRKEMMRFGWYLSGNTGLLKVSSNATPRMRRSNLAGLYLAILFGEAAPKAELDKLSWFKAGMAEWATLQYLAAEGDLTLQSARATWHTNLRKYSPGLALTNLESASQWTAASKRWGTRAVLALSAFAVSELEAAHGAGSLPEWCAVMKEARDPVLAFRRVFGEELPDFEDRIRRQVEGWAEPPKNPDPP